MNTYLIDRQLFVSVAVIYTDAYDNNHVNFGVPAIIIMADIGIYSLQCFCSNDTDFHEAMKEPLLCLLIMES